MGACRKVTILLLPEFPLRITSPDSTTCHPPPSYYPYTWQSNKPTCLNINRAIYGYYLKLIKNNPFFIYNLAYGRFSQNLPYVFFVLYPFMPVFYLTIQTPNVYYYTRIYVILLFSPFISVLWFLVIVNNKFKNMNNVLFVFIHKFFTYFTILIQERVKYVFS